MKILMRPDQKLLDDLLYRESTLETAKAVDRGDHKPKVIVEFPDDEDLFTACLTLSHLLELGVDAYLYQDHCCRPPERT